MRAYGGTQPLPSSHGIFSKPMGTSVRVSKPRSTCRKLTAGSRVSTIYFDRLVPRSSAPSIEGLSLSSSLPPWPCSLPSLPLSACSLWSCAWHYRVAAECNCGAPSASPMTGLPLPCSSAVRRCCSFFSPTLRYCVRLATSPLHRLLGSHYISKGSALYPQVLALWSSLLHRSASGNLHPCPCRPGPLRRRARIPSVQARKLDHPICRIPPACRKLDVHSPRRESHPCWL